MATAYLNGVLFKKCHGKNKRIPKDKWSPFRPYRLRFGDSFTPFPPVVGAPKVTLLQRFAFLNPQGPVVL